MNKRDNKPGGRSPRLSKRGFIILVLSICGVALIAEAVLLIHAFAGKGSKGATGRKPSEKAEPAAEKVWKLVSYSENGKERTMREVFSYDEKARMTHFEADAVFGGESGYVETATITYMKGGVKADISVTSPSGQSTDTQTLLLRDMEEECSGERPFSCRTGDYSLEYDERGYWKRISYESVNDYYVIVYGRDYSFDEEGRMTQYRDWNYQKDGDLSEITTHTVTYEYDEQNRLIRCFTEGGPLSSQPAPGEYLIEYGEGWRKESRYVDGVLQSEIETIYEKNGTWECKRKFEGEKVLVSKKWSAKMPDSYEYAKPIEMSFGGYISEEDFSYSFTCEEDGRVLSAVGLDANGESITMYEATYDEQGRISSLYSGLDDDILKFTYDENGNVSKIAVNGGTEDETMVELQYAEINLPNS